MRYLITGGTGTLGQALIRRLLALPSSGAGAPTWVASLSRDEVKAGALSALAADARLRVFLGDVRDLTRLEHALHGVHTVVHAAALKRVTESVYSPGELIKTNIQGTINVINAALAAGVKRVLIISSDKAVHPTNLYGMTKAVAECYAVQSNSYTFPRGTKVACVRYGNVLGSRGSVLDTWAAAAHAGLPLAITDMAMTRFWLTVDRAVDLVLLALGSMTGGEVYVPDLPASPIAALAAAVYRAVTGEAEKQPNLIETGLRPGGEKIHEMLLSEEEISRTYWVQLLKTYVVTPSYQSWTTAKWEGRAGGWERVAPALVYSSHMVPPMSAEALDTLARTVLQGVR